MSTPTASDLIDLALREDIGEGDVTTRYFTDSARVSEGRIFAKEPCVLAGAGIAAEVFRRIDPTIDCQVLADDGAGLAAGDTVLRLRGRTSSLLTGERVALNFLQRLSGIATLTRRYVEAIDGTGARILDTRKTTPGWRLLEKAAVKAGGGTNHRIGLYDMVMVKDNHLAANANLNDLQAAIAQVRREKPGVRIELEADTVEQVRAFAALDGVDIILLDNMPPAVLREALQSRRSGLLFEASGGVNLGTIRAIAETGVDFISVGALTHSAVAVDLSLEIIDEQPVP